MRKITEKKLARIAEEMENVEQQRQRHIREYHEAVERGNLIDALMYDELKCMSTGEMDGMWVILDILGYDYKLEDGKVRSRKGRVNDMRGVFSSWDKALNIALDAIDIMEPANDGRMFVNTNKIKENTKMDVMSMDVKAQQIVADYTNEHLDKSDDIPQGFGVFIVWKAKVLQNWKFLLSTTLFDGMYYELTYNGDKDEWYLDAYKKFENRCIKC